MPDGTLTAIRPRPRRRTSRRASAVPATEQALHAAIVAFLALNEDARTWCYFHANNGGRLSPKQANAAKARGVRAGVPDLVLSVATAAYRGVAWAEIKTARGTLSPEQVAWCGFAHIRGERTFTLRSVDDACAMLDALGVAVRARPA